jgi:antitoxin (DNA-binding transcriptional repressor) of toxin-antitoxin stability system
MEATTGDLRYRMKDILSAIDRGETVTLIYRGKARAMMTPISPQRGSRGAAKTRDQPLFGMWKDREDMADPASYVRDLRRPRMAGRMK